MGGSIHCITTDKTGTTVAIAYGPDIALVEQHTICESSTILPLRDQHSTIASWTNTRTLPEPPSLPGLDEELPTPSACALHFLDGGKLLVVSYVDHGIVYDSSGPLPNHSNLPLMNAVHRCWDVHSMELKWQITPRACNMYVCVSSVDCG